METHQYPKNHAARDLHHDVFPCVSPGKVPMLPPQVNLTDRPWPFLGSFALHAVLVAIISCPAFQYPIFISSQTPAIFWFSPASLPDSSTEAESPLHGPSVAFAAQQEASVNEPFQLPASAGDPVRAEYQETAPEPPADIAEPALTIATPVPVKKTVDTVKFTQAAIRHTTPSNSGSNSFVRSGTQEDAGKKCNRATCSRAGISTSSSGNTTGHDQDCRESTLR